MGTTAIACVRLAMFVAVFYRQIKSEYGHEPDDGSADETLNYNYFDLVAFRNGYNFDYDEL